MVTDAVVCLCQISTHIYPGMMELEYDEFVIY